MLARASADNLRGVLHALNSNFKVEPSDDDKAMLEDIGFPFEDYDATQAVPEDDPTHVSNVALNACRGSSRLAIRARTGRQPTP